MNALCSFTIPILGATNALVMGLAFARAGLYLNPRVHCALAGVYHLVSEPSSDCSLAWLRIVYRLIFINTIP